MVTQKFHSACPLNCPDKCAFLVYVEDGRIVSLEGNPNHPYTRGSCCSKGHKHVIRTYSKERLLYPMKRQDDSSFKRISWDKALDEIAMRIRETKEAHGPQSVGIYTGSGNIGMASSYASRFANVLGTRMIPGASEICYKGGYEGARFNVGPFPPHELGDWANSKCILIWGTNKFESSIHSKRVIQEAIDNGAKLVVIDPRKTPHAKMADIYTTIRPGTDAALALGIANVIIRRNLYNHEFVESHVAGFEQYKRRVAEYDLKRVTEITWVEANAIEAIAVAYSTHGPALIMTGPAGFNHYTNGTWAARAVHSLVAICGYLGVSGGGFQYSSSDYRPFNSQDVTLHNHLDLSITPIVETATYLPEYILSSDESPLRVLVIQAANPITQWPNANKTKQALEEIPYKVCIDQMMTDTARLCDIVLPATTLFEHHNLVHSSVQRIVQYAPKIVEPLGEAKHELEIWTEIAERVSLGEYFKLTEIDAIRLALESDDCAHIEVEDLIKHPEGIRTTSPAIPFSDRRFTTRSGKFELFSQELKELGYDPLPVHEEPAESPLSTPELYEEFPLIMITGRLRTSLHSQFTTSEVGSRAYLKLHPDTAKNLGLTEGDLVSIESRRGRIDDLQLQLTEDIDPRVVWASDGWWVKDGNMNLLTDDLHTAFGHTPGFNSVLVSVTKSTT